MIQAFPAASTRPTRWSRFAIASTVLALIGFLTLWLGLGLFLSAVAAVCGHMGRHEVAIQPLRGRSLATLGVGLGYVSMLSFPVLVVAAALLFPAVEKWRSDQDVKRREASLTQASELFVACEAYARANKGRYPQEWEQLSGRYLPERRLEQLLRSPYPDGKEVAFELVAHDRPVLDAIRDSVIVIQEISPPRVTEVAVVYANGKTRTIHNPDYESP